MFFNDLMPISETTLNDIIDDFDTDNDGQIDREEFEAALHRHRSKKKDAKSKGWGARLGSLGSRIMKGMSSSGDDAKLDCAYQLSDIERIESINLCTSATTEMYAHSSWAELVFAIFIKGEADPLMFICSKPELRQAWVDAFCTCYVNSTQMKADSGFNDAKRVRKILGWQHRVIRASIFSLVVCDDVAGLTDHVTPAAQGRSDLKIDDKDAYHGYTPLHYAVSLNHVGCALVLLKSHAKVNLQDNEGNTPLDLGK